MNAFDSAKREEPLSSGIPQSPAPASSVALSAYLEEQACLKTEWGKTDCCRFAAEWVRITTGEDPILRFTTGYRSKSEAGRIIAAHGGLPCLADKALAGFPVVEEPEDGDIGLLRAHGRPNKWSVAGFAFALYRAGWWIGRAPFGIAGTRQEALKVWRIAPSGLESLQR